MYTIIGFIISTLTFSITVYAIVAVVRFFKAKEVDKAPITQTATAKEPPKPDLTPYEKSPSFQACMRFLAFCKQLPQSNYTYYFITPFRIGIRVDDREFQNSVDWYLSQMEKPALNTPTYIRLVQDKFEKNIEEITGGSQGLELYKQLNLNVCQLDDDHDHASIYMTTSCGASLEEMWNFHKALMLKYEQLYGQTIEIYIKDN